MQADQLGRLRALRSHWTRYAFRAIHRPPVWFEDAGWPRLASLWLDATTPVHNWLCERQARYVSGPRETV